jgi:hypothetical protein
VGLSVTREEREQMIAQLHLDIAENLADLAEREARTLRGEDPPEWQVPEDYKTHREQQTDELIRKKHDGGLIYKERQNSLVSAALDLTDWHQWAAVMVKTLDDLTDQQGMLADELDTELGQNLRKQNDAMSKRINALENIVDDLAKRVEALQQSSGYEG